MHSSVHVIDYVVLVCYLFLMAGIGAYFMRFMRVGLFPEGGKSRRVVGRRNGFVYVRVFCLDIHWRRRNRIPARRNWRVPHGSRSAGILLWLYRVCASVETFTSHDSC